MKQYNQIWVPDEKGKYTVVNDGCAIEDVSQLPAVIVLTPKEALEMWNAARQVAQQEISKKNLSKVTAPHFYEYFQSKGIRIEQA